MPTRNVSITEHQDRWVDDAVGGGRYQSASEVVREGLRLLERRDAEYEHKLARLRDAIDEGRAAYDRGEYEEVSDDALEAWVASLGKTGRR